MQFSPDLQEGHNPLLTRSLVARTLFVTTVALLTCVWLGMLHSPEPNWDEGWTLGVARTWVERGIYGQLSLGEPQGPGLPASFLTVGPIALAFKLLGVGFWQARVATALLTLASLGALALLARRLYGPVTGAAVIPVLLLTTIHATGNPLYVGRQAMGEPAMLLFLALTFLTLVPALARPWPWAPVAMLMGGLALISKGQPAPFLSVALLTPVPLLLWRRRWVAAATLLVILAGSFGAGQLIVRTWELAMAGRILPSEPVVGLTRTLALVPTPEVRVRALIFTGVIAVPALLGMAWASWYLLRDLPHKDSTEPRHVARLALLAFVGTWYGWYLLLSVGWARYLYPVPFLGAVFTAAMLDAWTGGFRPSALAARLRAGGPTWRAALVGATILAVATPASLFHLAYTYPLTGDRALHDTAAWLNRELPADAVVETNETELFVYLDRPYHFPPEQVHVHANERLILREDVAFGYDPLTADPDYLVEGRLGSWWKIYTPAIEAGHFRPVQRFGHYTIYERVRAVTP